MNNVKLEREVNNTSEEEKNIKEELKMSDIKSKSNKVKIEDILKGMTMSEYLENEQKKKVELYSKQHKFEICNTAYLKFLKKEEPHKIDEIVQKAKELKKEWNEEIMLKTYLPLDEITKSNRVSIYSKVHIFLIPYNYHMENMSNLLTIICKVLKSFDERLWWDIEELIYWRVVEYWEFVYEQKIDYFGKVECFKDISKVYYDDDSYYNLDVEEYSEDNKQDNDNSKRLRYNLDLQEFAEICYCGMYDSIGIIKQSIAEELYPYRNKNVPMKLINDAFCLAKERAKVINVVLSDMIYNIELSNTMNGMCNFKSEKEIIEDLKETLKEINRSKYIH